jgi:hypothetical protein
VWDGAAEVEDVERDFLIAADLVPRSILAHSAPKNDFPVPYDNQVNVPWSEKECTYLAGLG